MPVERNSAKRRRISSVLYESDYPYFIKLLICSGIYECNGDPKQQAILILNIRITCKYLYAFISDVKNWWHLISCKILLFQYLPSNLVGYEDIPLLFNEKTIDNWYYYYNIPALATFYIDNYFIELSQNFSLLETVIKTFLMMRNHASLQLLVNKINSCGSERLKEFMLYLLKTNQLLITKFFNTNKTLVTRFRKTENNLFKMCDIIYDKLRVPPSKKLIQWIKDEAMKQQEIQF